MRVPDKLTRQFDDLGNLIRCLEAAGEDCRAVFRMNAFELCRYMDAHAKAGAAPGSDLPWRTPPLLDRGELLTLLAWIREQEPGFEPCTWDATAVPAHDDPPRPAWATGMGFDDHGVYAVLETAGAPPSRFRHIPPCFCPGRLQGGLDDADQHATEPPRRTPRWWLLGFKLANPAWATWRSWHDAHPFSQREPLTIARGFWIREGISTLTSPDGDGALLTSCRAAMPPRSDLPLRNQLAVAQRLATTAKAATGMPTDIADHLHTMLAGQTASTQLAIAQDRSGMAQPVSLLGSDLVCDKVRRPAAAAYHDEDPVTISDAPRFSTCGPIWGSNAPVA